MTTTELFFSRDGTRMVKINNASNAILYYTLSTPWDLDTATEDK